MTNEQLLSEMQRIERHNDIKRLEEENRALREALTDIAVYGCGMLGQPPALNGDEMSWLRLRLGAYEGRALAALAAEPASGEADKP